MSKKIEERKMVTASTINHKKMRVEVAKTDGDTIGKLVDRALEEYFNKN